MATRRTYHTEYRTEREKVKWDPKTIEIRTHSVEKALEPLVMQVTTLVNRYKSLRKKGKSKSAHHLVREIVAAIDRLIKVGYGIANDFPEIADEMYDACQDTKQAGEVMGADSKVFANDPHSSDKRSTMTRSARALLSAVTRLLCIADMADVCRLLAALKLVEERLSELEGAGDPQGLIAAFKRLGIDLMHFAKLSGARQADLKDPRRKEEIAAARAQLKDASRMLLTSSKVYIQHPDVHSAKTNRDFVLKQMSEALQVIYGAAQATGKSEPSELEAPGVLAGALDNFDANLVMDPAAFLEQRTRTRFEEQMERILAGARRLSELPSTRATTKEKLLLECANVRTALQELITEYVHYAQTKKRPMRGDSLDRSIQNMTDRTQDLRKQMKIAVADHISDTFLDTLVPLMLLVEAARDGNQREVEECAIMFTESAAKLEEAANLACSVSNNTEGVKLVRVVRKNIHALCPQVINAARTLAARPRSKAAQENMDVFKNSWEAQVRLLIDAVDEITGIDEFLAVSENHIGDDVETCIKAMKERDIETFDRSAGLVRGRTDRVISAVQAEMENYERGPYTEGVERTLKSLREDIMPRFAELVESTVEKLNENPHANIDEEGVTQAAQMVYDVIRDIRKAVQQKTKRYPNGEVMNEMGELYSAEIHGQNEFVIAKEEAAYEQIKAAGKVHYDIRGSGGDDIGGMGVASIKVNGVEYCPKKTGHNIVVLDPAGQFVTARNFDTTTHEAGVAMGQFLDDLPEDHIVLVATQETTGVGAEAAGPALERLGGKGPFDPGHKASWAFAGYTGPDSKPWIHEESRPAEQGPSLVSNLIFTPAYEQGKIKLVLRGEGADDPDRLGYASIIVNGVERSARKRGHNIVVLDENGDFVVSRAFDTGDASKNEGSAMARFLDGLPNERIVLISTQDSKGVGVNEAKDSLARLGATGNVNPGPGGSWAFMGYTGPDRVDWVTQAARVRHQGPCVVSQYVTLPAAAKIIEEEKSRPVSMTDLDLYEETPINESDDEEEADLSKKSDRALMRALPEEEKAKIERLSTELRSEKSRFETMLSQWDDSGNEIIVLAKKMCMMMMDMSDFTRGTGSLKTTMDVINAAKRIARAGSRMNGLATEVADRCNNSQSKNDLLAYIQRITLFSHQLTITSRVKADIQMVEGVEVVSALESASSLIMSAKNLMNSVILTVKACYVASTKYRGSQKGIVNWRMRAPAKKPLIHSEQTDLTRSVKSTKTRQVSPLQALSEFDTDTPRQRTDF